MWNIFRSKPKSEIQAFVEGALKLSGKRAAEVAEATEIASGMLGGLIPPLALAKHAEKLAAGPMPYKNADLGVATALFFFREDIYHEVLRGPQLGARMMLLEYLQSKRVNPMLAKVFENSLYERFAPDKAEEYDGCYLARWPALIEIFDECLAAIDSEESVGELIAGEGIAKIVNDEFVDAVQKLKTTSAPIALQYFAQRAMETLVETSKSCPEDQAYDHALKGTVYIVLGLCLGVAPAVELASGVPTTTGAAAMLGLMSEMEWDPDGLEEFEEIAGAIIAEMHERLAPLAVATPVPGNSDMKKVQSELQTAFGTIGINFMQLHPTVHRAVLLEAMKMGGAAVALESFKQIMESAKTMQSKGLDPVEFIVQAHAAKLQIYEG